MSARNDIASYTMACVQEKLQPVQLTAVTTRSTLILKQLVTIAANVSSILYMVTHIHSYNMKGMIDTITSVLIAIIWITCFVFEFIYSFNGEVHLHFEEYKSLSISCICAIIICLYDGEITAIAILIFMCIEMAITCIKCAFGTINPNALQNLIKHSGLRLQSVPCSILSTSGYFNGLQLIQRDYIEFYKDINLTLFSTINAAQKYPKETHINIYDDLVNIYNLALHSHHTILNRNCCSKRHSHDDTYTNASYNLVLTAQ